MGTFLQDIRYGARVLLKTPLFTMVAVLVVALGVGANTAIFSVVNAILLRPLPFEGAGRIVAVKSVNTKRGTTGGAHSFLNFADVRAQQQTLEAVAAFNDTTAALSGGDAPEQIVGIIATPDLFRVLAVKAQLGRVLTQEDERAGGSPVAVITDGMWRRRFGSDPNVVGRQVSLNGRGKTVVGVLGAGFRFPFVTDAPEFFLPMDPASEMNVQRGASYLQVLARLKPGVTIEQADAEARAIAARLEQQYPEDNANDTVSLVSAQEDMVGSLRRTLLVLLGAVGCVLLIACANVANLLLARAAGRGREMAVRVALGASRGRIVRQLLTESLLLAGLGGGLGLLFAMWGVDVLSSFAPASVPRFGEAGLDPTVLGFTVGATLLTGVVFGLAPALQASKLELNEALKEGGRSATEGSGHSRVRSLLIVSEVALSLVLLVGAGLLIKSFVRLRNTNPGFDPRGTLTASVSLPSAKYADDDRVRNFYAQATERVARLPGVESVGAILPLPLSNNSMRTSFAVGGRPAPSAGDRPVADARIVTPGYLRAMGVPLLRGRDFDARDGDKAPKVIIVNETFARRFFPGEDALGKRLNLGLNDIDGEIVGVVGDVRHRRLDSEPGAEYYVPAAQVPINQFSLVVRTRGGDPAQLAGALRSAVKEIDADQPLYEIRTMSSLVADSMARQRFSMILLASFAGLALLLAAFGIFSVMSFLVAQRTHEIGIRMALGAQTSDILRLVVGHAMTLTVVGVCLGLAAAFALTRVLEGLLYEVKPNDPAVFGGLALVLSLVALAACLIPARRATKVDPMVALRYE
jgi:putative ABC transport system permease protein